jgi:hypothetical protein
MKKRLNWVATGHSRPWPANRADSVRDEDTGVMAETILAMAGPKIVDQVIRACSVAMKTPGSRKP